ncbi:hypothetical protein VTN49DRAFT_4338 [Thermomyces lanuginosus]|uniref:uncharacterized protein n=1 Tax=Thermomyces lanuginosus TaxID=5541 RepID=UPI00374242F1
MSTATNQRHCQPTNAVPLNNYPCSYKDDIRQQSTSKSTLREETKEWPDPLQRNFILKPWVPITNTRPRTGCTIVGKKMPYGVSDKPSMSSGAEVGDGVV